MNVLLRPHHAPQGGLALGAWTGQDCVGTATLARRPGARPVVAARDPAVGALLRSALEERSRPRARVVTLAARVPDPPRPLVQDLARAVLAAPLAVHAAMIRR